MGNVQVVQVHQTLDTTAFKRRYPSKVVYNKGLQKIKEEFKMKRIRSRNWVFIVYPDSIKQNWKEVITNIQAPWVCSPLHDKDTDENGQIKKPHYHCLISFTNQKSYQQVLTITGKISATNPQSCNEVRGMIRYFAHLDTPTKFQYSKNQIQEFNGFDVSRYLSPKSKELADMKKDIRKFCLDNEITEITRLYEYTDTYCPEWSEVIDKNSTLFNTFIASIRYRGS